MVNQPILRLLPFLLLSLSSNPARTHPTAIAEDHGDAALKLLEAGAEQGGFR